MKTKFKNYLFFGIFALFITSCTTEEYITEEHYHYDGSWVFSNEYIIGQGRYLWTYDPSGIYYCNF